MRRASTSISRNIVRDRLRCVVGAYLSLGPLVHDEAKCLCKTYLTNLSNISTESPDISSEDSSRREYHWDDVYANNFVDMEDVKVIGFDLDYTLVTYTTELQNFIYDRAKQTLVDKYGFPDTLKLCSFDENFAIRGLSVDPEHGLLLKLSNSQRVGSSSVYKGKSPLSSSELQNLYGPSRHIPIRKLETLWPLYDKYAFAKACLIADSIDHFEMRKRKYGENYLPRCVVEDVYQAIESVHMSGSMHNAIIEDMHRYINPAPKLYEQLGELSEARKVFFLCTNSGFEYTNRTLSHVLNIPFCHGGKSWREIFDVVVCSAKKPSFYREATNFREWNEKTSAASAHPVQHLAKDRIYLNGSAWALSRSMGWYGKDILYLGDNLHSDLQQARRWHGWHTGCIIEEVEQEVKAQCSSQFRELHSLRSLTHALLIDLQLAFRRNHCSIQSDEGQLLSGLQGEMKDINSDMSSCFNQQFGGIFRTDTHPSLFAVAVRKYADIYMKDLSCLMTYSAKHKFYPTQSVHMAHDQYLSF